MNLNPEVISQTTWYSKSKTNNLGLQIIHVDAITCNSYKAQACFWRFASSSCIKMNYHFDGFIGYEITMNSMIQCLLYNYSQSINIQQFHLIQKNWSCNLASFQRTCIKEQTSKQNNRSSQWNEFTSGSIHVKKTSPTRLKASSPIQSGLTHKELQITFSIG